MRVSAVDAATLSSHGTQAPAIERWPPAVSCHVLIMVWADFRKCWMDSAWLAR